MRTKTQVKFQLTVTLDKVIYSKSNILIVVTQPKFTRKIRFTLSWKNIIRIGHIGHLGLDVFGFTRSLIPDLEDSKVMESRSWALMGRSWPSSSISSLRSSGADSIKLHDLPNIYLLPSYGYLYVLKMAREQHGIFFVFIYLLLTRPMSHWGRLASIQ
jgi:hypothetical protein